MIYMRIEPLERRWLFDAGQLDQLFGSDGTATSIADKTFLFEDLAVTSDGSIIAAGTADINIDNERAVRP